MKILMIGQLPSEVGGTYTTGVCNVVYELSRCSTIGIDLIVYATNISDNAAKRINGTTCYRGTLLRPYRVLFEMLMNPVKRFRQWWFYKKQCHANFIHYEMYRDNIYRIIQEEKPDIIHCMNLVQMSSAYFANEKFNIPLILTFHGVNKNNDTEAKSIVDMPDYTTCLTNETLAEIIKRNYPKSRSIIIPNGVDTNKFYFCDEERRIVRENLGIDDITTVLLTVGSIQHRKGQYSFIQKLSSLGVDFKYKYILIGRGPDEGKIRKYICDNGLEDKVIIIGYVANADLYKYYSAADVYIHGSYEEGQALSEVEAYATDLKIALNKDVLRTVITDTTNKNDYYVFDYNKFDSDAFVLWARNHRKKRISRKQYDWREIFKLYVALYYKILSEK
ncbi:glycosyltransferase involved in cell wall biosynthesis [Bacteroides heparinolyticus]|uniref:Glycosyltransferase involved in cell wall biosynthesis n=1 Tax=Prevotella heparinolytica TaxID=28113 RepID=A0A4R2LLS5_9BACE|nr:glycosyltransferase family 4 protein [Bacteroides heparinolyticus]TCO88917.1 glycosyltransferase involved in cell wall biosynthesis [Bacteroides heparinolyticus]